MKNNKNKKESQLPEFRQGPDMPKGRDSGYVDAIPGINTPGIELPAFNPPVPNRAWTAMRAELGGDEYSEEKDFDLDPEIDF